ncbi:relaxase/mobilization nuclease domain-containing protein [Sphingomonas edaphi]|nr:relaxase/mobilization nuclease domain-containing protein [Sphingomonas edaphi]
MRGTRLWKGVPWAAQRVRGIRSSVVALTTYIVDADPHALVVERAAEVLSLTSYAMALDMLGVEPGEKVEEWGSRNLVGQDLESWQQQMIAVATMAPATAKPMLHIILSLVNGEEWAEGQADEAMDILLQILGLARCMIVWSRHGNTANPHLHLCVIRVDPVTGSTVGSDWLIDDLHQAVALIDERQNRARTPDALYVARGGAVYDVATNALVRDAQGKYQAGWYKPFDRKRNHLPAALREAKAELIAAAQQASTWAELHLAFAEAKAVYERKPSGARIRRGSSEVKASLVDPRLSRTRLEERLGAFEPDPAKVNLAFEAFRANLDAQRADLRARREREKERVRTRAAETLTRLPAGKKAVFKELIEAEAQAARSAIGDAFKAAIKHCTDQRRVEHKWMAEGQPAYAPVSIPAIFLPGDNSVDAETRGKRDSLPKTLDWSTEYRDEAARHLFTDHRHLITLDEPECIQAIDDALSLAAERWRDVLAKGPPAFLHLVAERSAELGLNVVGEDGHALERKPDIPSPAEETEPKPAREADPVPDPEHEKRVAEAIERLLALTYLPLRRTRPSVDGKSRRTGDLELVLDDPFGFYDDYLKDVPSLAADRRIQEVFEEHREALFMDLSARLLSSPAGAFPTTFEEFRECLPKTDLKLHRAFRLVRDDEDFGAMVQKTHTIRSRLEREAQTFSRQQQRQPPLQHTQKQQDAATLSVPSGPEFDVLDAVWSKTRGKSHE